MDSRPLVFTALWAYPVFRVPCGRLGWFSWAVNCTFISFIHCRCARRLLQLDSVDRVIVESQSLAEPVIWRPSFNLHGASVQVLDLPATVIGKERASTDRSCINVLNVFNIIFFYWNVFCFMNSLIFIINVNTRCILVIYHYYLADLCFTSVTVFLIINAPIVLRTHKWMDRWYVWTVKVWCYHATLISRYWIFCRPYFGGNGKMPENVQKM